MTLSAILIFVSLKGDLVHTGGQHWSNPLKQKFLIDIKFHSEIYFLVRMSYCIIHQHDTGLQSTAISNQPRLHIKNKVRSET